MPTPSLRLYTYQILFSFLDYIERIIDIEIMSSRYNTRPSRTASASSSTSTMATRTHTQQRRHFCIVLTNNP